MKKEHKLKNGLLLVFLLSSFMIFAQDNGKTISGTVVDVSGISLPNVSVYEKGTTNGTITNTEGEYSLKLINSKSVVVFAFIGFETKETIVGEASKYNIVLEQAFTDLDEVVVTALGIKRKTKALGYAVTEVNAKSIAEAPSTNAISSLSGKVAGVDVSNSNNGPGNSLRVVIRGNSSFSSNNQPLYVIDGVPMDNQQLGSAGGWGGMDLGDGISGLNPDDIESISVLKGPSAAALYGTRAQHGVIIIETKKGKARKDLGVEFKSNIIIDVVAKQFKDVQRVYGQGSSGNIPKDQSGAQSLSSWGAKMDPNIIVPRFDGGMAYYGVKDNNMLGFFNPGYTLTNTVSLTGGSENSDYRLSYTDLRNKDIIPNSGMDRQTITLHGSKKIGSKIRVVSKITYQNERVKNRPFLSKSGANIATVLTRLPANFDQAWLKDNTMNTDGSYKVWSDSRINPYYVINNMSNNSDKDRIMGFVKLNYEIASWLNLRIKGGIDTYFFNHQEYAPRTTPNRVDGEMIEIHMNTDQINGDFLLTAKKKLHANWDLSGSIGGNIMYHESNRTDVTGFDEVSNTIQSINNYKEFTTYHSNPRRQINSLYAFGNIAFKNYIFVDLTARNDWSSTLPNSNNSFFYPSVASSFVFTDAFELNSKILSFGKIRASYAEVGGDTDPYNLHMSFGTQPYSFNGNSMVFANGEMIPNLDLLPSRTKGYEFGLDLRFFNSRINLDATYYSQTSYDEIINLPVPTSSGFKYALQNAGEILNYGIELLMTASPVRNTNWDWDLSFNFSSNRNEVIKLSRDSKIQELARAEWVSAYIQAQEGKPYGQIVGYDIQRTENKEIIYENGLPIRTENPVLIGNGVYDWIGGVGNKIRYKNLSLSVLFDIKAGADVLSMTNMTMYSNGTHINTLEGRKEWNNGTGGFVGIGVMDDGTGNYVPNDVAVNPQSYYSSFINNGITGPYVYEVTYVKLRELALTYTLSKSIAQKIGIQQASIGFVARNLLTLYSSIPNIDPESSYNNGNGKGFEYGSLPSKFSAGINLSLMF